MDDKTLNDKTKIQELLNEITNLQSYSNELSNNTRGEKLENYIEHLNKNIVLLSDEVERIYQEINKTSE